MKDEIISLLKDKLSGVKPKESPSHGQGGGSDAAKLSEINEESKAKPTSKKMTLPSLPKFIRDGDTFDRWLRKFSHYAELEQWTECQKLLQLELYLTGRAELCMKCFLPMQGRLSRRRLSCSKRGCSWCPMRHCFPVS